MKKILDCLLILCFAILVMSSVMFIKAEYSPRLWVHENQEFIENFAAREPEDPTRIDTRYSALILSFNQNEKPDTFGPKKAEFHYDFEGKGRAIRTGWAKPTAGLLLIDQDGGPKLLGYDGAGSGGFDFLAGADANGDGLIDGQDPVWADLKIWLDKNSNGLMDDGELHALPELKITCLELKRQPENRYLIDGNFIKDAGLFHYDDQAGKSDQTGRLDEIFLRQHSFNVKFAQSPEISPEIAAAVPNIPGSGLVRNLREAAMLDPELAPLAARLLNASDDEERWARLDELMSVWARTGGLKETWEERCGDRYELLNDGFDGAQGAELARRVDILEPWIGHHLFLLPHELNPVQQLFEPVIIHNPETGEISFNYQPVRDKIDLIYYTITDGLFKKFFPGNTAVRPGTEALFNKADGQADAQ